MKKKFVCKIMALLLCMVSVFSMTACSGGGTETEHVTELNVSWINLTKTLDPAYDGSTTLFARAGVGESLVKCNTEGKLVPWLAESIESTDKQTWTITIKDGVKFSNGNVCDATAVMNSLQYLCDNNKGLNKSLNIESMSAEGNVLTIKNNSVTVDFESYLSHPQTCIQDTTVADKSTGVVGTGPYKFTAFKSEQSATVEKNDNYRGTVNFEKINIFMNNDEAARWLQLQSGDVDLVVNASCSNIETIENSDDFGYSLSTLTTRDRYVIYNLEGKYTSNVNFRKGLDCLVDKNTIVNSIMLGTAIAGEGCVPAGYDATPDYKGSTYDKEKALEYFKAAGLTVADGKVTDNGQPINLVFHSYDSFSEMNDIVQLIQSGFASVGINATVNITSDDIDDYLGDTSHSSEWDLSMASMFAVPRGDAAYILNTCFDTASQYNYSTTRVANDKLQGLIEKIKVEVNDDTRTELIKEAALEVEDQCYMTWYMNPQFNIVYNKKKLSNVPVYASEQYYINDELAGY